MNLVIQRLAAILLAAALLAACEVSEPGRATPPPLPTQAGQPANPTTLLVIPVTSTPAVPPTEGPYVAPYPAP